HRAGARDAARQNLAALRHERSDQLDVLVVDVVDLVRAELADLTPTEQRAALTLLAALLVLVVLAAATAARSSLSEWHLNLRRIEMVVVHVVHVARRASLAGLSDGWQSALDAAAFRIGLPLRARALDDLLFFVDADDHVANHLVHHAKTTIQFLHQLAGSVDHVEDVHALLVMRDLVGEPLPAPVLGLLDGAVQPRDDLFDLLVQFGDLLFGRFGGKNVDEL